MSLTGPVVAALTVTEPAASVRLLLPTPGLTGLVLPAWDGNEFLLPTGRRPTIRTFTPRRVDPAALELDVDIVVHGPSPASDWARRARPGDEVAVSGPGRGTTIDRHASRFLLAGDETAIPAISQLLEALPPTARVDVRIEIGHADARLVLPDHPAANEMWTVLGAGRPPGDSLVGAVEAAAIEAGSHVWAAGEAAAMQRIRRLLFDERGLSRAQTTIRGYWKHGRAGAGSEA
ncbi:MAG: siderophore-interacting protein [Acidimicrobiales bacterium]